MGAGPLRDRLRFERRAVASDGAGNEVADFAEQFTQAAEILPLRGGEEVLAARLAGRQPVVIRVRYSDQAAAVTSAWRAVDERSGVVYAIRSAVDQERRRQYITMMAEAGVGS